MFYILDRFLAYLQHKGKFGVAIIIGEFISNFTIFDNSRLLIQSRIAFLYNYKDKEIAFNKIKELASEFVNTYDSDKYGKRKLALIAKIFDMYAISLQAYKRDYKKSMEMDLKAISICCRLNDTERMCHIRLHIISLCRDSDYNISVDELFNKVLKDSKDNRVKFCAYIEIIKYYKKKERIDSIIYFKSLAKNFIEKNRIMGKYPNEEKVYNSL